MFSQNLREPEKEHKEVSDKDLLFLLFGPEPQYEKLPAFTIHALREYSQLSCCCGSYLTGKIFRAIEEGRPFVARIDFPFGLSRVSLETLNSGPGHVTELSSPPPSTRSLERYRKAIKPGIERVSGAVEISLTRGKSRVAEETEKYQILGISTADTNIPTAVVFFYRPKGIPVAETSDFTSILTSFPVGTMA